MFSKVFLRWKQIFFAKGEGIPNPLPKYATDYSNYTIVFSRQFLNS